MMRFAVMIEGQEAVTWERWLRIVDATEALGFDSLWRSDHLWSVIGMPERETLALWPSLAAVALRTQRIAFGQLVSPTTFRHPVELAQNAVALDHLSGGRYWLGLGAGWNVPEHAAFGFPLPSVSERMDRLAEAIDVILQLWTGEPVTYTGRFFHLERAQMRPTPRNGRVPIVIGGGGERRLLRLVAQAADEWNTTSITVEQYPAKVAALEAHCRAVGRDPSSIAHSWMVGYLVGRDQGELRERARWLQQWLRLPETLTPDEVIARQRERGWIVGTPKEVIDQIAEREALGISRIMLQTYDLDDLSPLELIAREVMPAFQSA